MALFSKIRRNEHVQPSFSYFTLVIDVERWRFAGVTVWKKHHAVVDILGPG